jgi:cell division protein FtsB
VNKLIVEKIESSYQYVFELVSSNVGITMLGTFAVIAIIQYIIDFKRDSNKALLFVLRFVQLMAIIPLLLSVTLQIFTMQNNVYKAQLKEMVTEQINVNAESAKENKTLSKTNQAEVDNIKKYILQEEKKINERIQVLENDIKGLKAKNPTVVKKYGIHI